MSKTGRSLLYQHAEEERQRQLAKFQEACQQDERNAILALAEEIAERCAGDEAAGLWQLVEEIKLGRHRVA